MADIEVLTPEKSFSLNSPLQPQTSVEDLIDKLTEAAKTGQGAKLRFLKYRVQGLPQWEAYLQTHKQKKNLKDHIKAYNNGGLSKSQKKHLEDMGYQYEAKAILVARRVLGSDDNLKSLTRSITEINVAKMAAQDNPEWNLKIYSILNRSGTTIQANTINLFDIDNLLVKNG